MATTFVKIQTVTVGSGGAANIEFTSIPQTYTDLKVVISARSSRAQVSDWTSIQFNANTSNYSMRVLSADGSSVASFTDTSIYVPCAGNSATASVFGNSEFYIPNYTSANNKSVSSDGVNENNATSALQYLVAGLWSNTSAITSIKLQMITAAQTFEQYSTATLYGIKSS